MDAEKQEWLRKYEQKRTNVIVLAAAAAGSEEVGQAYTQAVADLDAHVLSMLRRVQLEVSERKDGMISHVCGLHGFDGMLGHVCPACARDRAAYNAARVVQSADNNREG